ncbi:hypothetical protein GALMADRAFT_77361 [Galerina marginata CBS 339.88]|uniref:DUF6534 domain-containing protein n=1 Tax=Galerina marginata (strain CBS 339.88) TaxID=685588 RepID=A0A067SI55_GALM3|nr:hypothetical protein GALMADRAFT_77361 [Galerina marginata CBS 339.88]
MGLTLVSSAGPLLIGIGFNAILLGVMCTQVYLYYSSLRRSVDPLWIKIFVACLFFCDIINTAFNFAGLYIGLIEHYGQSSNIRLFKGLIVAAVQFFYAWRIFKLTRSWVFPLIILATSVMGGVGAIITTVKVVLVPSLAELENSKVVLGIWLASEALADVLITVILVTHLRTGMKQTDLLIDRIIRITIQTGMITAVVAALDLFLYLFDPTGLHLIFNYMLCKLYSNSLMSTLNSRGEVWKARPTQTSTNTQSTGNPVFNSMRNSSPSRPEIFINVESHKLAERTKVQHDTETLRGTADDKTVSI